MTNEKPWLTDFCANKHMFVSIIMVQILVIIYALSFLSLDKEFLPKLSILTLWCQFIGINILIALCKLRNWFNYLDVYLGVFVLIVFVVVITSVLAQLIGYLDLQLSFNLLGTQKIINFVNLKLSLSAVMISLALIRYFYIQDQWAQQVKKLSDARLNALQARIKPHFLFNSLNSIAALIAIDTNRAEKAITDFSSLMRRTFAHQGKFITIEEELNWVKQYLNMEKLRLDERLIYKLDCPQDLLPVKVPVLCIQPLVENAIIHGIQPLEEGGTIELIIMKKDNNLNIQVTNPYIDSSQEQSNGTAIENIQERLDLQYGNKATVVINDTGSQYQITLSMPL
ncbi:MAG: histidine kinase [Proteobacteria bacterium]|nr:histidine kinase [Pseudomonadota bacterium]